MKQKFDDPIERSNIVLKIIFMLQGLAILIGGIIAAITFNGG